MLSNGRLLRSITSAEPPGKFVFVPLCTVVSNYRVLRRNYLSVDCTVSPVVALGKWLFIVVTSSDRLQFSLKRLFASVMLTLSLKSPCWFRCACH